MYQPQDILNSICFYHYGELRKHSNIFLFLFILQTKKATICQINRIAFYHVKL